MTQASMQAPTPRPTRPTRPPLPGSRHARDRDQWLAQVKEDILEPDLPICDPHHHLWDHPGRRYLIDELLADTGSGHNVRSTVFVECMSMYRADGPAAMRPVGETEFVNGVAAMSRSGRYGPTRVAAGIVSFADLTLGEDVGPVLTPTSRRARAFAASATRPAGMPATRCASPTRIRRRGSLVTAAFAAALPSSLVEA
jgi:hypothetical protein